MKRYIILSLIFIIFFSLNRPINANDAAPDTTNKPDASLNSDESKIVINKIVNYDLFTKGAIIAVNDYVTFNEFIENQALPIYISGYNDNNCYASLTVDYIDTSEVDLQKVGTYPVYTKLKLFDDCIDDFILADNIEIIKFDIRVSDPNVFDVFVTGANSHSFDFSWLSRESKYFTLYYIESTQEITFDDLKNDDWQIFQDDIFSFYRLNTNKLNPDKHYYFYFTDDKEASNIIHIYYDNGFPFYESMTGDRDGGDTQSPPLVEVEQPAPDISNSQDVAISSDNQSKNKVKVNEYFGVDKDEITGQRVLQMQENSRNDIRFSKHSITVIIPVATVNALNIKDTDIFSIEINKLNDYSLHFDITLNGEKLEQLNDMKIMVPYTIDKETSVTITGPNNEKITGNYDSSLKIVTFITNYPGTYKINYKQENKTKKTFNYFPIVISIIIIICLISFIYIKKGRKNVKEIY